MSVPTFSSGRVLLFAGHLIDAPGRMDPRFPPELEPAAARAIARAVADIAPTVGIASAARGGDILFHEVSRAQGIPTVVVLPFQEDDEFEKQSVAGLPKSDWEARFRAILAKTAPSCVVHLGARGSANVFSECNRAMLAIASASDPKPTLLALWDRKGGDGPGGTAEMVNAVEQIGGRVIILDPLALSLP
jgi:hypothetical protein